MHLIDWLNIYIMLAALYGLYKLGMDYLADRAVYKLLFVLSLSALAGNCLISIFGLRGELWAKLSTVLFVLSGLLEMVRISKPAYFRFPQYFSYLPIVSLVFLPIIRDSKVLYDLINITYQGGALLVSILVLSLLHFRSTKLYWALAGLLFLLASYITFWFFKGLEIPAYIIFGIGIVLSSKGFQVIKLNYN